MTARGSFFAVVLAAFVLFFPGLAGAADWAPPKLDGHVVDEAHVLTPEQSRALDTKLERARRANGFAVVVYLLPKLPDGLAIEDVGYKVINTWGVGSAKGADGIVLAVALEERKIRIETGKGAGGAITDIGASHINREVIGPLLKENRVYDAMDQGTDAIEREIAQMQAEGSETGKDPSHARKHGPASQQQGDAKPISPLRLVFYGLAFLAVIVLSIVSPTFRGLLFFWLLSGGGRSSGGGWSSRDDDDGGSGYRGGGGSGGGGGSTDDY